MIYKRKVSGLGLSGLACETAGARLWIWGSGFRNQGLELGLGLKI